MQKIHIATDREIGKRCIEWAKKNLTEDIKLVEMDECDIFISVLYDKLITPEYIYSHTCFNFHPGYLPDYRGSGAYSWVIINNESTAGVTLHIIDKDIDHGPILDRVVFPVPDDSTAESLFHKAENTIYDMFQKWWRRLVMNQTDSMQPNIGGKVYYRKELDKAKDLTRFVRAFTFEGKEDAYYFNRKGEKVYVKYDAE